MKPLHYTQQTAIENDDIDKTYIPKHSCLQCVYASIDFPTVNFTGLCKKYNYIIRGPYPICDIFTEMAVLICDQCGYDYHIDEQYCPRCGETNATKPIKKSWKKYLWLIPVIGMCLFQPWTMLILAAVLLALQRDSKYNV